MKYVTSKVFNRRIKDGEWEATMDVTENGLVEVRVAKTGKLMWVRVD